MRAPTSALVVIAAVLAAAVIVLALVGAVQFNRFASEAVAISRQAFDASEKAQTASQTSNMAIGQAEAALGALRGLVRQGCLNDQLLRRQVNGAHQALHNVFATVSRLEIQGARRMNSARARAIRRFGRLMALVASRITLLPVPPC